MAEEPPPIRVLVVDDHRMFADSLARLLADAADIDVVGTASSVADAVAHVRRERPDVVLLDQHLPDGGGVDAVAALHAEHARIRVVVLTGAADDALLRAAVRAGCAGFLTKDHAADEVVRAVRAAAAGEVLIPPELLARLLPRPGDRHALGSDLSARERQVLELLVGGTTTRAIAADLHLSVNTVRNHIQQVLVKLGAHSKLEAVSIAIREGIVARPTR